MSIKSIIFDRHGVFDKVTGESIRDNIASHTEFETRETVREKLKDVRRQYDLGILSPADTWAIVQDIFQFTEEQTQDCQNYINTVQPIQEMWNILPSLQNNYTLGILSDCPRDKKESIQKQCDMSAFKFQFWSCDYAKSKSDGEDFFEMMYAYLYNEGIVKTYEEILFVDDSIEKVEIAQGLGMFACHFHTVKDLEKFINIKS